MQPDTYELTLPGPMLQSGFWLYVWRVETPGGDYLYVGRTGDSSSPNAKSPYQRLGQHLGRQPTQNMLRQHLESQGVRPEECLAFHMVAYGPMFPEAGNMDDHKPRRNIVASLEKALAEELAASGYNVVNTVRSRGPLDRQRWNAVRDAFADHFSKMRRP